MTFTKVSVRDKRLRIYIAIVLGEFGVLGLASVVLVFFDLVYVLEREEKIIGGCIFSCIPGLLRRRSYVSSLSAFRELLHLARQKDTFYLNYVTIDKIYQGNGYASILVQEILQEKKNLYFAPSQKRLEGFYAKYGAVFYTTDTGTHLPGIVGDLMIFKHSTRENNGKQMTL